MRVQHPGYAGMTLALPFKRDPETGKLESVVLDAQGCADVPDRDGQWFLATPGWREPLAIGAVAPVVPEPVVAPGTSAATRKMVGEMLAHADPAYAARYARNYATKAREEGRTADADLLDETATTLEAKAPAPSAPTAGEGGLGVEIDELMTKKDALAFAELHKVTTLAEGMLLREMKDALHKALLAPADAPPATDPPKTE
jgi:hypothetical protein